MARHPGRHRKSARRFGIYDDKLPPGVKQSNAGKKAVADETVAAADNSVDHSVDVEECKEGMDLTELIDPKTVGPTYEDPIIMASIANYPTTAAISKTTNIAGNMRKDPIPVIDPKMALLTREDPITSGLIRNDHTMAGPIVITTVTSNVAGKRGEELDHYIF